MFRTPGILQLALIAVAVSLTGPTEGAVTLGGSYKSIFSYEQLRQQGAFDSNSLPTSEQRLRLEGTASKDWFLIQVADELSLTYQQGLASPVPVPNFFAPTSFWVTESYWVNTPSTVLLQRVDRAFVQVSTGPVEIRVGKQIIDEGVGHIFNAVSQMQRYPFTYIDPEYPKTDDAVSVVWKGSLTLEARYLPKVAGQREDSFHVRAKGSKAGYDVALTAGRSDDKPYAGLEAAGNLGDSLLRGELVGYEWEGQSAVQGLIGWDDVFSQKLSGQFELFYNGFGQTSGYVLAPFVHRSAPYRGKLYAGAVLTWQIAPRWKSAFDVIVNLNDPSVLLQGFIDYSIFANLDVVLGRYQLIGGGASEFGGKLPFPLPVGGQTIAVGLPDITYVELKYYF